MDNLQAFKNLLRQREIYYEEDTSKNGEPYLRMRQSIKGGGTVVVIVSTNDKDTVLEIGIYNVAIIENPLKREEVLKLINELNGEYAFAKFCMAPDGEIYAVYSMAIGRNGTLDPGMAMTVIFVMLKTIEDNYSKFMRLRWS